MEFNFDLFSQLMQTVIYVLIAYAAIPLLHKGSKYIDKKQEELTANIKDAFVREKVNASIDLIQAIVLDTAQTFVDPLKALGEWDAVAAEEAKQLAIDKATQMLTTEGMEFLSNLYGDATEWIVIQIESYLKTLSLEKK